MGALNDFGYGIVGKGARGAGNDRAHRITYEHFIGPITPGMFVCHQCDVPSCCNPDHLFLGTNADNMRDCRNKGRASNPPRNQHIIGEAHPCSKLTSNDVIKIRNLKTKGFSYSYISKIYGVSDVLIYRICKYIQWKHVA